MKTDSERIATIVDAPPREDPDIDVRDAVLRRIAAEPDHRPRQWPWISLSAAALAIFGMIGEPALEGVAADADSRLLRMVLHWGLESAIVILVLIAVVGLLRFILARGVRTES